jgi:hypothetical protein
MSSHYYLPPPGTPPRRAVSTSSRYDPDIPLLSGQGAGVIVFPELELQNMPMLVPLRRNGEVCAQSCLPASAAVPYKPLPPPPPVQRLQGRSLHSLRNLRWVDEKSGHLHVGTWSNSSAPARASRASRNSSMLIGDVPRCDDHQLTPSARRLKIIIIIACIIVIGLLTGLLGGFLAHRERHRLSS